MPSSLRQVQVHHNYGYIQLCKAIVNNDEQPSRAEAQRGRVAGWRPQANPSPPGIIHDDPPPTKSNPSNSTSK